MKKLLAILLTAIIILSFAGCGNSTAELEELLVSEKWVDIYSGCLEYEFFPGGGTASSWNTWEIVDEENIKITCSGLFGTNVYTYRLAEKSGMVVLEDSAGEHMLVRESEFDEARNTIEYPQHITKAVVTDKTGEMKIMSEAELREIARENSLKFGELYRGAYVEIIGIITEISGKMNYLNYSHAVNAHVEVDGWDVEISSANTLSGYDVGDRVRITGYIYSASDSVFVFIFDGKPTTIEHYNG